jgi:WD40 repeat protein
VYAIDWSPRYKFIVSCGMDRNVLLWNPFSVKSVVRPIMV